MYYFELKKKMARALSDESWKYGLDMNGEGFVPIQQLLQSFRRREKCTDLHVYDIYHVAKNLEKGKYEIIDDKIRSLQVHSYTIRL